MARASLEELRLDYEDFLRQRGLPLWPRDDPRRSALIACRPVTADDVARWALELSHSPVPSTSSTRSVASTPASIPELAANGALVLLAVACGLLDRQLAALERAFLSEGGFTERLYQVRASKRSFIRQTGGGRRPQP